MDIPTIKENQMEKEAENEMGTGVMCFFRLHVMC